MGQCAADWGKNKNEFPDAQGEMMDAPSLAGTGNRQQATGNRQQAKR
jgi:hypothetical protein